MAKAPRKPAIEKAGRDDAAIVADPSASEKERRAAFKRLYGFDM